MIGLSSATAMKPVQVYKGRRSMRRGMPDERPPVDPWSSPRW
jgi:hypothetical protein